jgi:TolA-binding protein
VFDSKGDTREIEVMTMSSGMGRWWVALALAGALLWAQHGASVAHAQESLPERTPGTRADLREDRQEVRQLEVQIQRDRQKLEEDREHFGKRSPQVRGDRAQLRHDKHVLARLHHDISRDKRIREHREEHWQEHEFHGHHFRAAN